MRVNKCRINDGKVVPAKVILPPKVKTQNGKVVAPKVSKPSPPKK